MFRSKTKEPKASAEKNDKDDKLNDKLNGTERLLDEKERFTIVNIILISFLYLKNYKKQ